MSTGDDAEANVTPLRSRKRKSAGPKRTPTPAQRAAGIKNVEAGRKKRLERAKEVGPKPKGERSRRQQLIAGEITVADLDDEELFRMQTRDRLGDFSGTGKAGLPNTIIRAMKAESVKRGQAIIDANISKAVNYLATVLDSPVARPADKLKAADMLMSRGMGSVPQHVIQHEGTKWDEMLDDADDPIVVFEGQEDAG